MSNHVFHLGPGIGGIDPHGHPPRPLDTKVNNHPLGAIIPDNGDTISSFKPHGNEGRAHKFGHPVIFIP